MLDEPRYMSKIMSVVTFEAPVWGLDRVMNTTLLETSAIGPMH